MAESRYEGVPPRVGGRGPTRAPLELAPAIPRAPADGRVARALLAVDGARLARWEAEAARRNLSVEELTDEAIGTWLALNHAPLERSWRPGDPDRRRNNRSLLAATGTKAAEHLLAGREPRPPS